MLSILAAARGIVVKRTRADWLIVAAAALIILLATTLLSAGMIYAGAVSQSGLRRTLHDAPVRQANVEISVRVAPDALATTDGRIRDEIASTFAGVGAAVTRVGESDSFQLPPRFGDADHTNLTLLSFYDHLADHASLVDGAWPAPAGPGDPLPVAISQPTASLLGLAVGDELPLTGRADATFAVPVRVAGIFALNDPSDPYWWAAAQVIDGVTEVSSYRIYGPLVVDESTFFKRATRGAAQVHWYAFPQFDALQIDGIGELRGSVSGLHDRLERTFGLGAQVGVRTNLADILAAAQRSLLVARTGVLILTVQLAVLAGYALLLTAGLLIEQRRVETALLRSRGASTSQVAALALMEGILLAVPAALIGPWLASAALRLLNNAGPLADIHLELEPQVTASAYLIAGIAGLACIVALVVPAMTSARSFISARQSRGRQQARGVAQRAGLDLALLAIAAIGFWQLRHYGAAITASVQGQLGLDPFLVAAPAVGLLAGAVLALRLIPLLAQLVDHAVGRTRGLVTSLGAWQVARRPLRYTRSSLLLMLAIALGVFAVSYTETWTDSQIDQANYQVGADMTVTPDQRVGTALPGVVLANGYRGIDGVEAAMPVATQDISISRTAGSATLVALDAAGAANVVHLRPDLAGQPFAELMRQLVAARPSVALVPLAGDPQRLRLDLTLDIEMEQGVTLTNGPNYQASIVIRDASGLFYRLGAAGLDPAQHAAQQVVIPLAQQLADGRTLTARYPVELAGIELRASARCAPSCTPTTLSGVLPSSSVVISGAATSPSLGGDAWAPLSINDGQWRVAIATSGALTAAPSLGLDGVLGMHLASAPDQQPSQAPMVFAVQPGSLGQVPESTLSIVAGTSFLKAVAASVGEETRVDIGPQRQPATVVGALDAFPTLNPNDPLVIADLPTLALAQYRLSGETTPVDAWWLKVADGRSRDVAGALTDAPFSSRAVQSSAQRGEVLRSDPVALGVIGALALGFVAAALFAGIGFVVSASVSARERLMEFALLRALGLSPGQLSGWLSVENGMLVLISLVGGTGLGLLMSWVALPFMTVTQDASRAVPPVIVAIPWSTIALLELITVAVLAVMVVLLGILLRRIGLGAALRLGDE